MRKGTEHKPNTIWPNQLNLIVGKVYRHEDGSKRKLLTIYKVNGKNFVSFEVVRANSKLLNKKFSKRGNFALPGEVRHTVRAAFLLWLKGVK